MTLDIVTRSEWGARPARSRHVIDTPTDELWLHHTAGALDAGGNGVWWDDVRGIQDFHMRPISEGGRGWSDIAYSFLIGGGQVFEGRGVGIAGGHTKGRNTVSHAICVVGNYEWMTPTPEDLRAIADLIRHGQERQWWGELTGPHRDAPGAETACCGRNLIAAIPEIRALAASKTAPPEPEDDMAQTIVFYADGAGGNHAYLVTNNIGKYLGPSPKPLQLAEGFLKIERANSPDKPLGPEWQELAVLVDGPLCNVGQT